MEKELKQFDRKVNEFINQLTNNPLTKTLEEVQTKINTLMNMSMKDYFSEDDKPKELDYSDTFVNEVRNELDHVLNMCHDLYQDDRLLNLIDNTIKVLMMYLLCFTDNYDDFTPLIMKYYEDETYTEIIDSMLASDFGLYEVLEVNDIFISLRNVINGNSYDCFDPMLLIFLKRVPLSKKYYIFSRVIEYKSMVFLAFTLLVNQKHEVVLDAIKYFNDNPLDNAKLIQFITRGIPQCLN